MSEAVIAKDNRTATVVGQLRRSRNSHLNSLRKLRVGDASLRFRSLRVPSAGPSPTPAGCDSADFACQIPELVGTVSLPIHTTATHDRNWQPEHEQQLSIPVPAPRFHTLKRHPYQNIPVPLKHAQIQNQENHDNSNQFMQVKSFFDSF